MSRFENGVYAVEGYIEWETAQGPEGDSPEVFDVPDRLPMSIGLMVEVENDQVVSVISQDIN